MSTAIPAVKYLTSEELEGGLGMIRQAPKDCGVLEWIVRRPQSGQREVLRQGQLTLEDGLVGDSWGLRRSVTTADGAPNRDFQLTIMGSRAIALVARLKDAWQWAGDQLFVDLDLSEENLAAGTRLQIGAAVVEISKQPHTGCKKFEVRFGKDALDFVNSPIGRQLRLRGLNAKIVLPGTIQVGDVVKKC